MLDKEKLDNLANFYIEYFGVIPTAAYKLAESVLVEEKDILEQIKREKQHLKNIISEQKQMIRAEKILNKK